MPFDNIITRADAPDRVQDVDLGSLTEGLENTSVARTRFRQIRAGKSQQRFPVLSALPVAYWVNGDTGLKQTTEMAWANKFINIEELAVIVPVPQNVLDDSDFDVWGESRPLVVDAIDRALDSAIFLGTNAPSSFPDDVLTAATAAGNTVTVGTNAAAAGGVFGDLDDLFAEVEDDGYVVRSIIADRSLRGRLRKARNSQGDRIDRDRVSAGLDEIDGVGIDYTLDGLWPAADDTDEGVLAFAGDFATQFVLALRKDVTFEVFREGVIQDQSGAIVYNLLQQDMVALRVTFRAGWQVANRINYRQPVEGQRYPAAVLRTPVTA